MQSLRWYSAPELGGRRSPASAAGGRFCFGAVVVILTLLLAGCGKRSTAEVLGLSDPPIARPVVIDYLCDASRGSSCTQTNLTRVVEQALAEIAGRPGSSMRVWIQGAEVSATRVIYTATSPKTRKSGRRAISDSERRWVAEQVDKVLVAVRPALTHHPSRSPIAESITRIGMASTAPEAERWIVTVSDGLEVSELAEFECRDLPPPAAFVRRLQRAGVLRAGSLSGVRVRMCHVDIAPIDEGRCPMTIARAEGVRTLWRSALDAAGVSDLQISDGAPSLLTETHGKETQ